MPSRPRTALGALVALVVLPAVAAPEAGDAPAGGAASPVMDILDGVLTDALAQAAKHPDPPYHLALALDDTHRVVLQATHGAFAGREEERVRTGDVDLRVGSFHLDNTHKLRDAVWPVGAERTPLLLPIEDAVVPLRELYYRSIDEAWRGARKQLVKVRANEMVKVDREDPSDDFSPAPAVVWRAPPGPLAFDEAAWSALLREASGRYLTHPQVYDSAIQLVATRQHRWLVTSDGTRVEDGRHHFRVATWGSTVADDGMKLQVYDYVDVASVDRLPDRAAVLAMVDAVARRVTELRAAPLVEPYAGPAILRGRAAGVFFHEIFGHRIEGHRQKDEDEGQTFTGRVGEPILPAFLSVVDDPTLPRLGGVDLNGHYRVDDEGVAAERVPLVEAGVLRNFLLSRSPIAGFPRSNGHGRRQPGSAPVARQGNLLVEASVTVPYARLRERLIAEVRKQGKPFGLVFDDISGGFTFTGRSDPNAFVVQPVTVWRVYPDGRPDELVRGVDLIGTPLTTFSRIVAAADDYDVFNGVCGAESGWVPVSAAAPSLLVSEVEVQRRQKASDLPPVLPPPVPPPGAPA